MSKGTELLNIIDWVRLKARIHMSKRTFDISLFPQRREIWWASIGYNIGAEIHGKNQKFDRPVLVIKVFGKDTLFVAPITSNIGRQKFTHVFTNHAGRPNAVCVSQLRTISIKRFFRKIADLPEKDFEEVTALIQKHILMKTETPSSGISSESPQGGPNVTEISRGISSEFPLGERNTASIARMN